MALQSGARCWLLKVGNARVNVETRGFFTVRSCDVRGDMRARALSTGGQRAFLDRGASVAISRTAASPRSKSCRGPCPLCRDRCRRTSSCRSSDAHVLGHAVEVARHIACFQSGIALQDDLLGRDVVEAEHVARADRPEHRAHQLNEVIAVPATLNQERVGLAQGEESTKGTGTVMTA